MMEGEDQAKRPSTPIIGFMNTSQDAQDQPRSSSSHSPSIFTSSTLTQNPVSPARYAATSNAFGLATSPTSPTSPTAARDFGMLTGGPNVDRSPPTAGTVTTRKLRRPSLLSLAQNFASSGGRDSPGQQDQPISPTSIPTPGSDTVVRDPSSSKAPLLAAQAQALMADSAGGSGVLEEARRQQVEWNTAPFLASLHRTSSAPPIPLDNLRTSTPIQGDLDGIRSTRSSSSTSLLDIDQAEVEPARSPLRWVPSHLQTNAARRKGKAKMEDMEGATSPPLQPRRESQGGFNGRPLPAPLLATLISESSPLEHEMRSEARLQRLIASHPRALPFTPRPSKSSRGRFPEMVDNDDDDDDDLLGYQPWRRSSFMNRRRGSLTDSDSDEMPVEEAQPEPVNSAFAAGMDMDRPGSSSSSTSAFAAFTGPASRSGSGSGAGTNNQPTPPSSNAPWGKSTRASLGSAGQAQVPSPGMPTGLPFAFGGLGVGNGGTPQASPTVERLELVGSPSNVSVSSPGLLQYRESQGGSASVRPGKRKANPDDRFDPYKRPRATSPAVTTPTSSFPMSPSRSSNPIPIPHSPSHPPFQSSSLSTPSGSNMMGMAGRQRSTHPYTRPMSSRSRAASPALSIGSTSGVLSTSLGERTGTLNGMNNRPSFSLGQAFIPTGAGAAGVSGNQPEGAAPQGLGGLGLLSLAQTGERRVSGENEGAMEVVRETSEGLEGDPDAMEED